MGKPIYIYGLRDPRNGATRYIGATTNVRSRFSAHLHETRKSHKASWIKSLAAEDLKPDVFVIEETSGDTWQGRERFWISSYRENGHDLTNLISGGYGCLNPTEETREKMRLRNLGKTLSAETRKKMSEWQRINAPMRGRHHTSSAKEKNRMAHLGKIHSEESREKLRNALLGVPKSLEHAAKIREAKRREPSMLGKHHSEETKAKMRESHRRRLSKEAP